MTVAATDSTTAPGIASNAARAGGAISADFSMFLKLLTTQMQNQDPLDPMDSTEYTQQLVQYSQVEQSVQQTGLLKDILGRLGAQDMAQAAAFIGREARFDSATSGFSAGGSASWAYQPDRTAASLTGTILDGAGKAVKTVTLDPAGGRFVWDGKTDAGTAAPEGAYTLAIKAVDAAAAEVPVTINAVGVVKDVVTDGASVMLGIGGVRLPLGALVAVGAPAG